MTELLNEFTNDYLPTNYPELYKKARTGLFFALPQDDGSMNIGISDSECSPEEIDQINEAWTRFYLSRI
jgi:hypothetical protein